MTTDRLPEDPDKPDVRSKAAKLPTLLSLKDGTDVRVEQVCYPLGKGFFRVTYEREGRLKGCLAENEGTRFLESDMSSALQKVEPTVSKGAGK